MSIARVLFTGLLAAAALVATGCTGITIFGMTRGSGNLETKEYDLTGFDAVEAGSAFALAIAQTDAFSVRVTADDNILPQLQVEVRNGALSLSLPGGSITNATLRAEITMPSLTRLQLSGASSAVLTGVQGADAFEAHASGASRVAGDVAADTMRVELSGASRATLTGTADTLHAEGSGASHLELAGLSVQSATVEVSGASSAVVNVAQALDATASGASHVRYLGNPAQVNESSSGASSITPQ